MRLARPDDWEQARDLRLEMLADTPIAYGRTLAWAQAQTDDDWRASAARASEDGTRCLVVVDDDGAWLGQLVGKDYGPATETQWEEPGVASVYLSPAVRGQGWLGAMVDDVVAWLASRGRTSCTLLVHEDNVRARRAYEKLGFVPTGRTRPCPNDRSRMEIEMRRSWG